MKIDATEGVYVGLSVLTILFIWLKIAGTISWSWWWVLSPVLAGLGFFFLALLIFLWVMLDTSWQ